MNTPTEQATLYRKAADTIEMCARNGGGPVVKIKGTLHNLINVMYQLEPAYYEFPVAILEGQLVWADTVVYEGNGNKLLAQHMNKMRTDYTLIPPKPKTVMVELTVEDASLFEKLYAGKENKYGELALACRKALDNLKNS